MSERQPNSANETSQNKIDALATPQRPGSSSQSQRRTPQKLGPRKHSHQNQSDQQSTRVSSAHDIERSGQDNAPPKSLFGAAGESQSNGTGQQQQQQQTSEQSTQRDQSRRRRVRRRGRGRSTTQTSESDTGSVSEVAQGGRRNRNRKQPDPSPQTDTEDAKGSPKMGGRSLDTLDEAGESADASAETTKKTAGGMKTTLEPLTGKSTTNKKKGKGKKGEEKEEKESNLRLRIDLDLDLELELKAKIQGAVTLALLD